MLYTISKGELWKVREALETKDPEDSADALGIVNSILDKNVTIEITEDQMLNDNPEGETLSHEDMVARYAEEDNLDLEEETRVC
jgi:hypothetical protein